MSDWKQFEKVDTQTLIKYIQEESLNEKKQDAVLLALMFRFRDELVQTLVIICNSRGYDEDVAYTIAENTFIKFAKTKKFNAQKCTAKSIDKCFKLYLNRIASNLLADYYRNIVRESKGLCYTGNEEIITSLPNINENVLSPIDKAIHCVLKNLPHEELVVYLTYKQYEKKGTKLPRKLHESLRTYLGGKTQSTIRSYKKKAFDKVKQAITLAKSMQQHP
ncbi:hypothetical protein [Aureispira sp. CCB-QB1]|uniref:hypothetical protein n=1 Tax=Aureispira sp. CCB-QB1 TaxID=1313421 RepID=UPI000698A12A|nr:hypothetical protein [Aureispira sp. CCB-QB1]